MNPDKATLIIIVIGFIVVVGLLASTSSSRETVAFDVGRCHERMMLAGFSEPISKSTCNDGETRKIVLEPSIEDLKNDTEGYFEKEQI